MSTACCHHLPGPMRTNYIVRRCPFVCHEPLPSGVEHRGACVGGECAVPCQALGPGGGFSSHSHFYKTRQNAGPTQTHTEPPTVAASQSHRAYRREADFCQNRLIKMQKWGLHDMCNYKSHPTPRNERRSKQVHWPI